MLTARLFKDANLADDVRSRFGAAPTAGELRVTHPPSGAMLPMNLGSLALHFSGEPHTAYRLLVRSGDSRYHLYFSCEGYSCEYELPHSELFDLGVKHAGGQLELVVQGVTADGTVHESTKLSVALSPLPALGTLYYGEMLAGRLMRAERFDLPAQPFITPQSTTSAFYCVGCHSVSRNGEVAAFINSNNGQNAHGVQATPTATPDQPYFAPTREDDKPTTHLGVLAAPSPDGSKLAVVSDNRTLSVSDARTNEVLDQLPLGDARIGTGKMATHPEWSPDGTNIVVALSPNVGCSPAAFMACQSSIGILPWDGQKLGTFKPLVVNAPGDAATFHFYPTWSPAGDYVAFVGAGEVGFSADSTSARSHRLHIVSVVGAPHTCPGDTCRELKAATSDDTRPTVPRFMPHAASGDGKLLFLSFASRRQYGSKAIGYTHLWLTAIDSTAKADPSFPAIWIPSQNRAVANSMPAWSE